MKLKLYTKLHVLYCALFCVLAGCGTEGQGRQELELPRLPAAILTAQEQIQAAQYYQAAMVHAAQYRVGKALQYLDSTLAIDSTAALAHFQQGVLHRRLSNYAVSSAAYRRAVAYKPDLYDAWYNLANNAFWQNQFEDAIGLFDTLLVINEAPAFWHNKGRAYLALGADTLAHHSFVRAVTLDSTYAFGYASLGAMAELRGDYAAMHQQYNKAVRYEPASDEYWYKRGMANMRLEHLEAALTDWDSTLVRNAFHFGALFNKGKTLRQLGLPGGEALLALAESTRAADAEIQRFRRGAERFPADAYYRHALGNLYVERKQWQAAAREFQLAIALAPDDIRSRINLGNVQVLLGETADAISIYKEALVLDTAAVDVLTNLAIVHMRNGENGEAARYWQSILRLDAENPMAHSALERLGQ